MRSSLTLALLAMASAAFAQSAPVDDRRPATATLSGDTGLWFIPTGEVLHRHDCSFTLERRGTNYATGFTNVGDISGSGACGLTWRLELFGNWLVATRVNRDLQPVFDDTSVGGFLASYPRVRSRWVSETGDVSVGLKFNIYSESRQNSFALAIRPVVKLPAGNYDGGTSTGAPDVAVDAVASKTQRRFEMAAYLGAEIRGTPEHFRIPRGAFRAGGGMAVPVKSRLRLTAEAMAFVPTSKTATRLEPLVAADRSIAPLDSPVRASVRAAAGLSWQNKSGFFVGAGLAVDWPMQARPDNSVSKFRDHADWQIRLGYHAGVAKFP